jgi:hypothetical protein
MNQTYLVELSPPPFCFQYTVQTAAQDKESDCRYSMRRNLVDAAPEVRCALAVAGFGKGGGGNRNEGFVCVLRE